MLSLLGGMASEEWYRLADRILALRPGLTVEWLMKRTNAEMLAIFETAMDNQEWVNAVQGGRGRCPLMR